MPAWVPPPSFCPSLGQKKRGLETRFSQEICSGVKDASLGRSWIKNGQIRMCKEIKLIWVYGHIPNDLTSEFWDRRGWAWHQVPVDICIANIVQILNGLGIFTLASCCGHLKQKGEISILEEGIDTARKLGYKIKKGSDGWPHTIILAD